jgi:hypothetical protein
MNNLPENAEKTTRSKNSKEPLGPPNSRTLGTNIGNVEISSLEKYIPTIIVGIEFIQHKRNNPGDKRARRP